MSSCSETSSLTSDSERESYSPPHKKKSVNNRKKEFSSKRQERAICISESEDDTETQPKRKYRRSIHHGLNKTRAPHHNATPEKPGNLFTIHNCPGLPQGNSIHSHTSKTLQTRVSYVDDIHAGSITPTELCESSTSSTLSEETDACSSSSLSSESSHESQSDNEDILIEDEEINKFDKIFEGSCHTKESLYTMIMLFVRKHSLSREAFTDLLLLISSVLPDGAKFSSSVYVIRETLKTIIQYREPKLHFFCEGCEQSLPNDNICKNGVCRVNGCKVLDFHDLRMMDQIKSLFQDRTFLKYLSDSRSSKSDHLSDIVDGQRYKEATQSMCADVKLTLTMNTDGVAIFSSTKKGSLWPVYLAINELPVRLRFSQKYIIPCFLYCQVNKPNMATYLTPMMQTLWDFYNRGMQVVDLYGQTLLVKGQLIAASLDLPARAIVSNMKQFNGAY